MRTSQETTTLIAALVLARGAFTPIQKDALGQVGKDRPYHYADLASILAAIMPGLLANGLVVLQSLDAETSSLITRVVHTSGEWVESVYPLGSTQTPQAFGSQLTYARRYSIQSLFCLAAADDDGATAVTTPKAKRPVPSGNVISESQRKRLFVIAGNAGWTNDQIKSYLLKAIGTEHTKAIRTDDYEALCDVFGTPFEPEGDHA